jgi:Family of unknown function (DUF6356)
MALVEHFTAHPQSVGETYTQHFGTAMWFSVRMLLAGFACMVHAVLPFMFVRTGSRAITELNDRMIANRRHSPPEPIASDPRLSL